MGTQTASQRGIKILRDCGGTSACRLSGERRRRGDSGRNSLEQAYQRLSGAGERLERGATTPATDIRTRRSGANAMQRHHRSTMASVTESEEYTLDGAEPSANTSCEAPGDLLATSSARAASRSTAESTRRGSGNSAKTSGESAVRSAQNAQRGPHGTHAAHAARAAFASGHIGQRDAAPMWPLRQMGGRNVSDSMARCAGVQESAWYQRGERSSDWGGVPPQRPASAMAQVGQREREGGAGLPEEDGRGVHAGGSRGSGVLPARPASPSEPVEISCARRVQSHAVSNLASSPSMELGSTSAGNLQALQRGTSSGHGTAAESAHSDSARSMR